MQDPLKPLKILWMIPKWTLPATDGARVATDSLIRNTIQAGAIVDDGVADWWRGPNHDLSHIADPQRSAGAEVHHRAGQVVTRLQHRREQVQHFIRIRHVLQNMRDADEVEE